MRKSYFTALFLCFSLLLCPGCGRRSTDTLRPSRVVSSLEVLCVRDGTTHRLFYTDEAKLRPFLLYLRLLDPSGDPHWDPEQLPHPIFQLRLTYLGGGTRTYRQVAHRFVQVEGRPWQTLDPAHAAGLYALLQAVPADPPPL